MQNEKYPNTSGMYKQNVILLGSGCGSVGRAVDFDTRGPRFDSSHRQNNCIEKTKINKKRPGMAHLLKKMSFIFLLHLGTSVIF